MSRDRRDAADRKVSSESGFALIEVIVALFLLGLVASAVLTFFVRGMQASTHLQRAQAADGVAMASMEQVRSVYAQGVDVAGTSGIVAGRAQTDVQLVWDAAAYADTADSIPASDPAATNSDHAAIPLVTTKHVAGIDYLVTTLIGQCYRLASGSGSDQACTQVDPGAGVEIYRATVVVTWKPTSSGQCGGGALCTYRTSALIDANPDANWNLTANPVATDDAIATVVGGPTIDYEILANDLIGSVTSNPVSIVSGPSLGSASVIASGPTMGMLRYTPPPSTSGITTLTYKLRDRAGRTSNTAVVTVSVAPTAITDNATVYASQPTTIDVVANDLGTFGASPGISIYDLSAGTATVAGGKIIYTAPASGSSASFTYTVTDTSGLVSGKATVILTVASYTAPVAFDETIALHASATIAATNLDLLTLTGNPPSNTIVVVSGPTGLSGFSPGTLVGSGTSAITYAPVVNTAGVATFTYYVQHPAGTKSGTKTVTLQVSPVGVADVLTVKATKTGTVNVGANDVPATGVTYAITGGASSACGTASVVPTTGVVTFVATTKGTCTVTYSLSTKIGPPIPPGTGTLTVTVN